MKKITKSKYEKEPDYVERRRECFIRRGKTLLYQLISQSTGSASFLHISR